MPEIPAEESALHKLTRVYLRDTAQPDDERPVVGYVGQDVPTELIVAAGGAPLRLRGNPDWNTDRADHYLGTGLDPAVRAMLAGILENRFGSLKAIVVSSDCDASQRLFYVLREIHRVEPEVSLPPVHLLDILHLPRETTARYNAARVEQFLESLQRWTGTTLTTQSLAAAIAEHDEIRGLQRRVMGLRRALPARISGADALAILGAGTRMPSAEYRRLLITLLEGADALPRLEGTRIFLTGSSHDSADVYRAVESSGAVIVGEDHDWGELAIESDVGHPRLDVLVRRYQNNGPTSQRASVQERAAYTAMAATRAGAELLFSYSRDKDDAPLWDFASQRAAVSLAAESVHRQHYGHIDPDELQRALGESREQESAS